MSRRARRRSLLKNFAALSAAKFKPGTNGFPPSPRSASLRERENQSGESRSYVDQVAAQIFYKVISTASSSSAVKTRAGVLA